MRERNEAHAGEMAQARMETRRAEEERDRFRRESEARDRRIRALEQTRDNMEQQRRRAEERTQVLTQTLENSDQEYQQRVEEAERTSEYWRRKFLSAVEQQADNGATQSRGATPRRTPFATPAGTRAMERSWMGQDEKEALFREFRERMRAQPQPELPAPSNGAGAQPWTATPRRSGYETAVLGTDRRTPAATPLPPQGPRVLGMDREDEATATGRDTASGGAEVPGLTAEGQEGPTTHQEDQQE